MHHSTKALRSLVLCMVFFISASFFKQVEAKRGCSSFGHSCFGGHGKRSEAVGDLGSGVGFRGLQTDSILGQQGRVGQDEVVAPKPIYPQSANDILGNGDDIIPIRNGGFMDNSDEITNEQQKLLYLQLSPYLRHWLIAYRKSQENNGYPYNNMI